MCLLVVQDPVATDSADGAGGLASEVEWGFAGSLVAVPMVPAALPCEQQRRKHRRIDEPESAKKLRLQLAASKAREALEKKRRHHGVEDGIAELKNFADAVSSRGPASVELGIRHEGMKLVVVDHAEDKHAAYSPNADINVAYSRHTSTSDIAKAHHVSERTVNRMFARVAEGFTASLKQMIGELEAMCVVEPPMFVASLLSFDEATQRVVLDVAPSLTASQNTTAVHTMVSHRSLQVGWPDGREAFIEIPLSPEPCLDTGASSLWEAIHSPSSHELRGMIDRILETATSMRLEGYGSDGAASNFKLLAHTFQVLEDRKKTSSFSGAQLFVRSPALC